MKGLGIVRKIDELGRVVIPAEVRKVNGWKPGTPMEILSTKEGVLFREFKSADGEKATLVNYLKSVQKSRTVDPEAIKKVIEYLEQK